MARKLTAESVDSILAHYSKFDLADEFILEAVEGKRKAHLRLKGLNGSIIMHQEVTTIRHARYMAARILDGGLRARYKQITSIK